MKIAVLFDGAGLARLGLEQAGHECTGVELDPAKHHLSKMVGSGNCILGDATEFDLTSYDAIWASPPCQDHSDLTNSQNVTSIDTGFNNKDLLKWSLDLLDKYPNKVIWIENVIPVTSRVKYAEYMESHSHLMIYNNDWQWGRLYNAAQFTHDPIQQRRRMIGGRYDEPKVYRKFQYAYKGVCPAITASLWKEYRGTVPHKRRLECVYYGRCLSPREAAYHQGLNIPDELCESWFHNPLLPNKNGRLMTDKQWRDNIYQAIGNGVPVYMAKAFGDVYPCNQ